MDMITRPHSAEGLNMSLFQFFGSGPKWTITCGNCEGTFSKRIPMVDSPGIPCPYCGAVNILDIEIGTLDDDSEAATEIPQAREIETFAQRLNLDRRLLTDAITQGETP